ncbi:hypothetical protein D8S78_10245 [Natrialba swarupiae]|nr:hypothetical protein [Natrialba swarupiae]
MPCRCQPSRHHNDNVTRSREAGGRRTGTADAAGGSAVTDDGESVESPEVAADADEILASAEPAAVLEAVGLIGSRWVRARVDPGGDRSRRSHRRRGTRPADQSLEALGAVGRGRTRGYRRRSRETLGESGWQVTRARR